MPNIRKCFVIFLLSCFVTPIALAEEPKEREPDPPWLKLCKQGIAKHAMYATKTPNIELKRLDHPILIHSQSIRDDQLGAVYLWLTSDGRPAVIADGIVAPDPDLPGTHYFVQEFRALTTVPITGKLDGRSPWRVPAGGIEWEKIKTTAKPPKSEIRMTAEARQMLSRLTAHGTDRRRDNQRQNYRLLTKPIYTYTVSDDTPTKNQTGDSPTIGDSTVGCVFAFCLALDPEILVCIEARTSGEKTVWYRAFADFSDMPMVVESDRGIVWQTTPRFGYGLPHVSIAERGIRLPEKQ